MKMKCLAALAATVFCFATAHSAHEIYDVKAGDVTVTLLDFEGVKAVSGTAVTFTKAEDADSKVMAVSDALGACSANLEVGRYILGVAGYDIAIVQASKDAKIEELQLFMPKEGLMVGGQEVVETIETVEGVEVIEEGEAGGSSAKKKGILLVAAGVVAAILLTDDDDDSGSSSTADAVDGATEMAVDAVTGGGEVASSGGSATVSSGDVASVASSSAAAVSAPEVVVRTRASTVSSGGSDGDGGGGGGGGGVSK